jgi:DNA repair exonuclease SbcCD ATPase subunit
MSENAQSATPESMSALSEGQEVVQQLADADAAATPEAAGQEQPQQAEKSPEAKKEEDRFAAKFAALSRKEKQIRQREQELEKRLRDIETRAKEAEEKLSRAEGWKEQIKKDPFKALDDAGLTYQELIERSLKGEEMTPEKKQQMMLQEMNERIERLNAELKKRDEESEKRQQMLQQQQAQAIEKQFRGEIQKFLDSKKDDFPLLSMSEDAVDEVFTAVDEYAKENPVSSFEEALALIEQVVPHLESYYDEDIKKRLNHPKLKEKLGLLNTPASEPSKPVSKNSSATLSNSLSQQPAAPKSAAQLSEEESKRYAASMLKWED